MNDLRAAAQQALEALESVQDHRPNDETNNAITALKAALAQQAEPVQKPVAWRWGYRSVTTGEMDWHGYVEIAAHPDPRHVGWVEPLYTAPPRPSVSR